MNILFFSEPAWPLHPGGAGHCSFLYAAELVRRGHNVALVCPGESLVSEVLEGVEIHRVPPERVPAARNRRTEENALARGFLNYTRDHVLPRGIDLIIDCGGFLSYFFSVTSEIRRKYHIPTIVYFHLLEDNSARDPGHFLNRISQAALFDFDRGGKERPQCFAVRAADAVICLTEEDAATVGRLYRPAHQYVLPPPVDPRLVALASDDVPRKSATSQEHVIVFAGRVDDHNKGPSVVRGAMERVLAVRSDVRLVVIGRAETGDFDALGSHVTYRGWIKDPATFGEWLRSADLLLMPSRFESFGLMCAEALTLGLPVIGSPVGGLREMIIPGNNGYLLDAHNPRRWPEEIANLILRLLNNPAQLAQMKRNAASAVSRYDVSSLGARLEQICQETLARREKPHPLIMPVIDDQSRADYLGILSHVGGRDARAAGDRLIRLLPNRSEARCQACCRRGIVANIRRVARLAKGNPARFNRAVFTTCPWSLVSLRQQSQMALDTGRITFLELWRSRFFFFLVKMFPR